MNGIPDPGRASKAVELIVAGASPFDAIRRETPGGREYWSGRELMELLGYAAWRDFSNAIGRARASAHSAGHDVTQHFASARKVAASGPAAEDAHLSRYACYLVAMNADPKKARVAEAQAYFVVRTRESEVAAVAEPQFAIPQTYADALRLAADEHEARLEAETRARELAVPASAWNELAEAAGDYAVADAAKVLSRDQNIRIGRDRLFDFMAAQRWIYRDKGWRAYQRQVDCGRLTEKVARPYWHEGRGEMVNGTPTVRITAKGLAELHRLLGGSGQMALMGAAS